MERLTDKIGNTNCVAGCGSNCKYGFEYCRKENWENCETISDVIDKLAEYEDLEELIGILPKELAEIFHQHIPNDCKHPQKAIVLTDGDVDKWREYKAFKKDGRLIKLPCKDVYFIIDINNPKYAMVMKRPIRELKIYEIEDIDKENCKYFSTEEKAKVKLKELRGGENE